MSFRFVGTLFLTLYFASTGYAQDTGNKPKATTLAKEQFFPIGIFSANPPTALKELREVGFNTVQTYRISSVKDLNIYLEAAANNDLKALVYPGMRIDEKKTGIVFPARALDRIWPNIRNDSALLAWYLADEPEHGGLSPQDLADFEYEIKKRDAKHLTALVTGPNHYQKYKDIGDILIIDPYPIPVSPVTEVSDTMEKAKKVAGIKPVWAVIQAFDRGLFEKKVQDMKGPKFGRETAPSAEEINCMTWLAVVHGAKGIFFYTFKELKYDIKEHAEIWNGVKRTVNRLNVIYPVLISPDAPVQAKVRSVQSGPSPHNIHFTFKKTNRELYLIAVNSNNRLETVSFSALPMTHATVQVVGEKRTISMQGETLTDTFKPNEVHIYKL